MNAADSVGTGAGATPEPTTTTPETYRWKGESHPVLPTREDPIRLSITRTDSVTGRQIIRVRLETVDRKYLGDVQLTPENFALAVTGVGQVDATFRRPK